MVKLVKHDLEFILKQIEIAEAHAAGGNLAELVAGYNGNTDLAQAHLLPYGLRTVDGSYNNLIPGREMWGAADQSFPGIFTPNYLNDADGDRYNFGSHDVDNDGIPDTPPAWYTNTDYANAGTASGSQPGPGSGTVIDADPRLISNLIVDQTLKNPAAIAAALTHAGMTGQPLMAALGEIVAAYEAVPVTAPTVPGEGEEPSAAFTAYTAAKTTLDTKLAQYGVEMDGNTVYLPNISPDDGLSSPFNGWMTIFGQFFDHGLDLVAKGGNGTVYVPLQPDDPLYVAGGQNYIPLTRVSVNAGADGILGTSDDGAGPKNLTTPWIDQNQTYASTASKQVFMREYVPGPDGKPIASGLLLVGSNFGLATWADIKTQARDVLGIELTDLNVGNIPLIAADEYGNFIPGDNGYPQLVVGMGSDGLLGTGDDVLREGNPAAPVSAQGVILTGHAFLDDIAHAAVPIVTGGVLQADADSALGYANADGSPGPQGQRGPSAYDNELLDRHFIAGDGRVNENIALTAVHQVFHSEHNRVVEMTKQTALTSGDLAFLNEWLLVDATAIPTTEAGIAALVWNGERLFQAGRFTNEMEYQHLVFEEFGRMMQPDIDAFVFEPSADINPSIAAEFAHVVYRFGHSMLRQDIAVIEMDENGNPVQNDIALFDGFLNPVKYDSLGSAEEASGAIIRGMSRQTGSEIDEFVTDVLRNQLLGIPLDLATINLARGRDVGTPPLNAARETFFEETGDTLLKPYESWADFALNLKNPASIINFIAAYGTHESVLNTPDSPKTVEQLRDAATKLVLGDNTLIGADKIAFDEDRLDFLNATGDYAGGTLGGLDTVDFWMGGLAEKKMSFGGMLGSTFSFVFQMTMENLQDADRFYYLSRAQGLNLLNELENNTFAELVMRNTDLGEEGSTTLPGNVFSAFEMPTLEMDISKQIGPDPVSDDPFLGGFTKLVERIDANNDGVAEYIRVNSNEHFTIGGTENDDVIVSGGGDDAIWGKGGDDRIEAGYGVDKVFGGEGDDIITNAGTDIGEADFLHGNEGNDVIHGGSGLSLLFGNEGSDFIITGPDGKEAFAGTGDDFVLGGSGGDFLLGNEGNDWLEGGQRFDTLAGENSELFFNSSIIGHDVLNGGSGDTDYDGESGDDVMFQNSEGIQRSNGMAGFDWAIHKGDSQAAASDLGIPIFETQEAFILRDRFDLVEGLSGWINDDTLTGRKTAVNTRAEIEGTAAIPGPDSPLDSYSNDLLAKNVSLIDGLAALVAHLGAGIAATRVVNGQTVPVLDEDGVQERVIFSTADASDILLGGGGSDIIKGLAGNDIIDGDSWLNVRIRFVEEGVAYTADEMKGLVYREADYENGERVDGAEAQFDGRSLDELMFDRTVNPGQLSIVREIVDGDVENTGDDIAVFTDDRANYTITRNADGSVTVDHTGFDEGNGAGGEDEAVDKPMSDGADRLFNIEVLRFTDGDVRFTPPELKLVGSANSYLDNFNDNSFGNSNGTAAWGPDWVEANDSGGVTSGQIRIDENGNNNNNNNVMQFLGGSGNNYNGAQITRAVDLNGATTASLTYSVQENGLDANDDTLRVFFSRDGSEANFVQVDLIDSTTNSVNRNLDLSGLGPFTANAAIRFVASSMENGDSVNIDNVTVNFTKPAAAAVNFETTFTEGGANVDIAVAPEIIEDSGEIVSARIVLTNAQNGDELEVPNDLPGGIDSEIDISVQGEITVILTGVETVANYQAAIQAIEFSNASQNPGTVDRIITVTVNDGFADSNVATTTVNVIGQDDPTNANNDTVITNISGATSIVVPEWVLLANDTDLDSVLDITGVSGANSLSNLSLSTNPGSVTFTDPTTGQAGGSFTYPATADTDGDTDNASVTVTRDTSGNSVDGTTGNNILIGDANASGFDGGTGDDIILAGAGNDNIVWNANTNGNTDGRDFVDGGADTDTFDVNTRGGTTETYRVYTRAAALAGPNAIAGLTAADLKEGTEIVITRTTGGTTSIIAELDDIEEIRIGTQPGDPTNGSAGNGDTVAIFGDFSTTSLALNTITIDGAASDDTVDISELSSAHRIVFRSNGGNDTIIGTLRPQDVVELPGGASAADYEIDTNDDGVTVMSRGDHSISFTAPDGLPQFGSHEGDGDDHGSDDEDEHEDDGDNGHGSDDGHDDEDDHGSDDDAETDDGDDHGDAEDDGDADSGSDDEEDDDHGSDDDAEADGGDDHDDDSDDDDTGSGSDDEEDDDHGNDDDAEAGDDDDVEPGNDDEADDDEDHGGEDEEEEADPTPTPGCESDDDEEEDEETAPQPSGGRTGTSQSDVLIGSAAADTLVGFAGDDVMTGAAGDDAISAGEGDDVVNAGEGRDVVFAGAGNDQVFGGAGVDMIYGEAGDDRLFGEGGNDLITAGAGNDTVVAGAGNDVILAEAGDGNDSYFGDDSDGGSGIDTLDMSAITANLTVDLGNGLLGRGSAASGQSGSDTLWSIENVATGSGNDTITASAAVNVIEGGSGDDTFRFLSKEAADGDTILDFEPGDRLDLAGIDADAGVAGNQSFTLVPGADFTASAQLVVAYETRADGDYTIVKGNVDATTDEDFRIELKGSHTLSGGNFSL